MHCSILAIRLMVKFVSEMVRFGENEVLLEPHHWVSRAEESRLQHNPSLKNLNIGRLWRRHERPQIDML